MYLMLLRVDIIQIHSENIYHKILKFSKNLHHCASHNKNNKISFKTMLKIRFNQDFSPKYSSFFGQINHEHEKIVD